MWLNWNDLVEMLVWSLIIQYQSFVITYYASMRTSWRYVGMSYFIEFSDSTLLKPFLNLHTRIHLAWLPHHRCSTLPMFVGDDKKTRLESPPRHERCQKMYDGWTYITLNWIDVWYIRLLILYCDWRHRRTSTMQTESTILHDFFFNSKQMWLTLSRPLKILMYLKLRLYIILAVWLWNWSIGPKFSGFYNSLNMDYNTR